MKRHIFLLFSALSIPKYSSQTFLISTRRVITTRGKKTHSSEEAFASDFSQEEEINLPSKRKTKLKKDLDISPRPQQEKLTSRGRSSVKVATKSNSKLKRKKTVKNTRTPQLTKKAGSVNL